MTNYPFARFIYFLTILLASSLSGIASEGKPVATIPVVPVPSHAMSDTVPPVKKPVDEKAEVDRQEQGKPLPSNTPVIKIVPKARKQIKPVALPTVPVKPPKIIKPIIKRVGSLIP